MNHGASASTTEEIASGQTAVRTEAEIVQLALARLPQLSPETSATH